MLVAGNRRTTELSTLNGVRIVEAGTLFRFASTPFCPAMLRETRITKADLIHLHLPNPAAVLIYLAANHKGPLVVSYHSDTVRHRVLARAFEPLLMHTLRRSEAIIAFSEPYVESSPILRQFKDRCRLIPPGIPYHEFDTCDSGTVRAIRDRHGERIVLAIGRLVYYKGLKYLIRAMRGV